MRNLMIMSAHILDSDGLVSLAPLRCPNLLPVLGVVACEMQARRYSSSATGIASIQRVSPTSYLGLPHICRRWPTATEPAVAAPVEDAAAVFGLRKRSNSAAKKP
jgi:hypothetical protein